MRNFRLIAAFVQIRTVVLTMLSLTAGVSSPAQAQTAAQAWVQKYSGSVTNSDSEPRAITVDAGGNAFVAGYSSGEYGVRHWIVLAYSGTGMGLWTNHYDGPQYTDSQANAVVVDANGNVFATGVVALAGGSSGQDYLTIKYSNSGVPLWTNYYNGSGNGNDGAIAMAVDSAGDVIVTGISPTTDESFSGAYTTIKYTSAGELLWTNRYHGPGKNVGGDGPTDIAVDGAGNVFVTGISSAAEGTADYATVAYSSAGMPLWTNRYNGTGNLDDYARAVAVDSAGNVVVTGDSWGGSAQHCATIKYSPTGVPLWTNRYHGPSSQNAFAKALAIDGTGNVIVTGSQGGFGNTNGGYVTLKYSNTGAALWTNYFNGPETRFGKNDDGRAVAANSAGNVFVVGASYNTSPINTLDFATIAYSAAGQTLWTNRYSGVANGDDAPMTKRSLAIGPDGSVYVTGITDGNYATGVYSIATIKYLVEPNTPRLQIARSGSSIIVSWSTNTLNFQLEENLNLAQPNSWSPVGQSAVTNGAEISVGIPANELANFFRLNSQ